MLAPVVPSKIVAVGLNYKAHAAEQGKPLPAEPLIFLKPSTAVIGPGDADPHSPGRRAGRSRRPRSASSSAGARIGCRPRARASYILGVTCVNDVTARELQRREGQYTRPKGFDTFAPVGPVHRDRPGSVGPARRGLGQRRRCGRSRTPGDLIFPVPELVAFISAIMTLLPGDIISTGTPAGIGPLAPATSVTRDGRAASASCVNPVVAGRSQP